jgi:nifR3 family TIM-barrel protein
MNFWKRLKKPFFVLAPMDGVTDTVFRQIVTLVGKPDVLVTEFIPVEALLSDGRDRALRGLMFDETQRPIVAQIWGTDPEKFFEAAKIIKKLGFDGIDINMGCPVKDVTKIGACSALIKTPKLAQAIINATIKGAGELPVSVKTRIGFEKIDTENWVTILLQTKISALTLHMRTAREMSKYPPHWDEMEKAVRIRNEINPDVLLIGNGDVKTLQEGRQKAKKYGIEGIMIGRGIFDNVWVFNENVDILKVTPKQKVELLLKHLESYKQTFGDGKHFALLKKFVKCYVNNFEGASDMRVDLMATKTLDELILVTKKIMQKF